MISLFVPRFILVAQFFYIFFVVYVCCVSPQFFFRSLWRKCKEICVATHFTNKKRRK